MTWHWRETNKGVIRTHKNDWLANRHISIKGYDLKIHTHLATQHPHIKVAIDVGANTGQSCIMMNSYCDYVYSIEPIPALYEQLDNTIRENCLDNCESLNMAAWYEPAIVDMTYRETNSLASAIDPVKGTISVTANTIDSLNLPADLLKIDVEGAELQVLQGAEQTIIQHRPLILVEMKENLQPIKDIEIWLKKHNYKEVIMRLNSRSNRLYKYNDSYI